MYIFIIDLALSFLITGVSLGSFPRCFLALDWCEYLYFIFLMNRLNLLSIFVEFLSFVGTFLLFFIFHLLRRSLPLMVACLFHINILYDYLLLLLNWLDITLYLFRSFRRILCLGFWGDFSWSLFLLFGFLLWFCISFRRTSFDFLLNQYLGRHFYLSLRSRVSRWIFLLLRNLNIWFIFHFNILVDLCNLILVEINIFMNFGLLHFQWLLLLWGNSGFRYLLLCLLIILS